MTEIQLPFEIIDLIITSNPNTIYTIYSKINSNKPKTSKKISRKRKTTNNDSNSNSLSLLEYIQNKHLYYFKKSSYLQYFINPINPINPINTIAETYILLEKYIHSKAIVNSDNTDNTDNSDNNINNVMFNLEEYLDKNLSVILLEKYMNKFMQYLEIDKLDNNYEIPDFIKLYIILAACKYFPNNNDGLGNIVNIDRKSYKNLMYILDFILENEDEISFDKFTLNMFIPLFTISIGMGNEFMIGWDIVSDRMIGFITGGSDGHESEYNNMMMRKYFTLDKQHRIQAYENMIGECECKKKDKMTPYQKIQNKMLNYKQNILKYLELFNINQTLINLPNPFEYLIEHKLLIF